MGKVKKPGWYQCQHQGLGSRKEVQHTQCPPAPRGDAPTETSLIPCTCCSSEEPQDGGGPAPTKFPQSIKLISAPQMSQQCPPKVGAVQVLALDSGRLSTHPPPLKLGHFRIRAPLAREPTQCGRTRPREEAEGGSAGFKSSAHRTAEPHEESSPVQRSQRWLRSGSL